MRGKKTIEKLKVDTINLLMVNNIIINNLTNLISLIINNNQLVYLN